METFSILASIWVGIQIGFWILSFVNIFKHIDWSGGKKILWVLIVLILGPLGTFLYLMFDQKKKWAISFLILTITLPIVAIKSINFNPSEKVNVFDNSANSVQNQSLSKTELSKLTSGDNITLSTAEVLERDLKKYYASNDSYPEGNNLLIGSGQAQEWVPGGFTADASESEARYSYTLKHPYASENEAFRNMLYSSENNNQSYKITFTLVIGNSEYLPGTHFLTPAGFDKEYIPNSTDEPKAISATDSDNDGLSDQDEINLWHTNPYISDTDGDGYSDGDEVKSGYNPLVKGK